MTISAISAARMPVATPAVSENGHGAVLKEVAAPWPAPAAISSTGVATTEPGAPEEDPGTLAATVDELNAVMKQRNSNIEFSIDEESGKTIVKVMDTESKAVLSQYPSRELLAIAKQIDQFQGLFIKTKA